MITHDLKTADGKHIVARCGFEAPTKERSRFTVWHTDVSCFDCGGKVRKIARPTLAESAHASTT